MWNEIKIYSGCASEIGTGGRIKCYQYFGHCSDTGAQIRIDGSDLSDEYVAKFIQRGRLKMWNPETRKWRSIIPFMFDTTETSRDEVARVLRAYYTKYVGYAGEILFVKWY